MNQRLNGVRKVVRGFTSDYIVFSDEVYDTTVCSQFLVHDCLCAVVKIILASDRPFNIWLVNVKTVAINLCGNFKN